MIDPMPLPNDQTRMLQSRSPDVVKPVIKQLRRKPGPVPRSITHAHARKRFEAQIAHALPELFELMLKAARTGDTQCMTYLTSHLLGKPAPAAVAPTDDHSLPTDARNRSTLEQLVIADLTDDALVQVKRIITADLAAQGKLTDGDVVEVDGGVATPPPPST